MFPYKFDRRHDVSVALTHKFSDKWTVGLVWVYGTGNAVTLATERYNEPAPVNLGTDHEITIKELAEKIAGVVGYEGEIRWDPSKPDGQPRRRLCTERAEQSFGFRAQVGLDEGLERTVAWLTPRMSEFATTQTV